MQMRTAAVSVAANIAEGAGRGSRKDSKRCLQIAYGSAVELLSHLMIAGDLGFLAPEALYERVEEVRRMLAGLMAKLR
jgi:four helix bundle protein